MGFSFGKRGEAVSTASSSDQEHGTTEDSKTLAVDAVDISALEDLSRDLRKDPAARAAFLATCSAEDERAIMRKVDIRFCLLIGFMFLIKNARHLRST